MSSNIPPLVSSTLNHTIYLTVVVFVADIPVVMVVAAVIDPAAA